MKQKKRKEKGKKGKRKRNGEVGGWGMGIEPPT